MDRSAIILLLAMILTISGSSHAATADKSSDQLVKEAKATIKEISVYDVKSMIDRKEKMILLDVRDKNEFEDGSIPGAINVSRGMLEFKVALIIPDKNAKIIVFCSLDLRGPLATRTLNEMGYMNAMNMRGGLKTWKEAGYAIAK
jgi:rhodanese-related sulfurtransferase